MWPIYYAFSHQVGWRERDKLVVPSCLSAWCDMHSGTHQAATRWLRSHVDVNVASLVTLEDMVLTRGALSLQRGWYDEKG